VLLPVSVAAHVLLFLVFRRFAPLRDSLLWFAAAGAASIFTSILLGITPVRLLLAPYPFEREAALTAAAAWFISAWFYWNIATAVFRRAGLASAALYTLETGLFPLRIGFVFIAAAFLLLTYLFSRQAWRRFRRKAESGNPAT